MVMYQIYIFFKYRLHHHGVYIGIHTGYIFIYHYLPSAGHVQRFEHIQLWTWYGKLLQQIPLSVWSSFISPFDLNLSRPTALER